MGETENIMKEVFLVSTKTYYSDFKGVDYQIADGDQIPDVYINAEKAIRRARFISNLYCSEFGYQVTINNIENPARKNRVLFAERLTRPVESMRLEIRVYRVLTWD